MHNKIYEECGIFGICNHKNAAQITAIGLHALQHRGQAACGIALSDNGKIYAKKGKGKVLDNFKIANLSLPGKSAIGHNRYPTSGANSLANIQPFISKKFNFAIAHNGQIISNKLLSDSHQLINLMEDTRNFTIENSFVKTINNIKGGFAIICLFGKKILAARDPIGIRPLILGRLNGSYIFCSESCALHAVGAEYIREIDNGEILLCDNNELIQLQAPSNKAARLCIFEYIYFARPDSTINNKDIYSIRKNMGKLLAKQAPSKANIIVPIQNSGTSAAIGYAQESGINLELALTTNNYTGRSFIKHNSKLRKTTAFLKHGVIKNIIKNQNIVLLDDSLVRGTSLKEIIAKLRANEVGKIDLRIASPIFKYPDIYGIDVKQQTELLSHKYPTLEAMAGYLKVDTIEFLSLENLYLAICGAKRNPLNPQYTDHYFTGEYPII